MANTTIQLKKSLTPGSIPSSLEYGELALNAADGILYYKDPSNNIQQITSSASSNSFSTINVGTTLLVATNPNDILSISGNNGIRLTGSFVTDSIVIDVDSANTSSKGVVQLHDGLFSNSNTLAATANSVAATYAVAKAAYDNTLLNTGTLTSNFKVEEFTANTGQTLFTVPDGYQIGYVSVYVNGVLLNTNDYVASNGVNITLNEPTESNDIISVAKWFFDTNYLFFGQHYDEIISSNNQTIFTANGTYSPGYVKVFRNGVLIEDSEFTANNGSTVIFDNPVRANDIVTLHYWNSGELNTTPVWVMSNTAMAYANLALEYANTAVELITLNGGTISGNLVVTGETTSNAFVLQEASLSSNVFVTSANSANQVIDSFSTSSYRSVKYILQVTSGTDYQTSEVILLHNDTNSFTSEYGVVVTNGSLMTYDTDISSGNVRLLATPVNNINTIKLLKTYITV